MIFEWIQQMDVEPESRLYKRTVYDSQFSLEDEWLRDEGISEEVIFNSYFVHYTLYTTLHNTL